LEAERARVKTLHRNDKTNQSTNTMAPRNPVGITRAATSTNDSDTIVTDPNDELAAKDAEIEKLKALLASQQSNPTMRVPSPTQTQNRFADALEMLIQRLPGSRSPVDGSRSTKLPDPPVLTDGKEPTFESWKLQVQGKLHVNSDHFATIYARKTYVFSRTGGDAQKHLLPRVISDSLEPFQDDEEMLEYLTSIYEDPFKKTNARKEYQILKIKPLEPFSTFHT
jgi:hypothetical protein